MTIDKKTLDGLRIEHRDETARRAPLWAIVAVLVLLAAAAVAFIAVRRPGTARVRVAPAVAATGGSGAVLNASGYVTARRQATVSSKVTGKVVEVDVEEGLHVRKGQILARLDSSIADRALHLAQAQATAARSALDETRVRIEQARLDYDRASALAGQLIASRSDQDHALADLNALRAHLAAQSETEAVARRAVALSQQDVDDTVIRAPFDGIVVSKDAQPGEMISPISAGSGFTRTGICTIVDMDSLEIDVDVAEAYINRVRQEQRTEAVLDAYPDWRIPSHVIIPVPTADRQKATVRVRIGFDVKDPRILPEMGVKVSFLEAAAAASTSQTSVTVPKAAIRRDGEQDVIFVVNDGHAERRAVKTDGAEGDSVRVVSGIAGGESVIVDGPPQLKDGDRVAVEQETK